MLKVPLVFIIYKRLETTIRVWDVISKIKPSKLYVIADGPRCKNERLKCQLVRDFVESKITWNCDVVKVYSNRNLGCAKRVQSGLDYVFENEERAIILEDDTLPDPSFFSFCEELLERFKNDDRVVHISGCNLHSDAVNFEESYCFSSIVNIWGWATWKRAWRNYDIKMPSWENEDKNSFISSWCPDHKFIKGIRKMFDLHCNNEDPWTWDSQWVYACWKMNGFSILPFKNLVSNIGIGPDASNTKQKEKVNLYPSRLDSMTYPLIHPSVSLNNNFDYSYYRRSRTTLYRKFASKLISISKIIKKTFIHA